MSNMRDIKDNIQITCEIFLHGKDGIKQVQNLLPKKIGQMPGASKIHELVFEIDGRILKKNLPDENSYKQVLIKLGRFPARPDLNEAILEPDDLDE